MLLRDFLRVAKAGWAAAPALEVVIGNEAADADSCVSALVYGLLLHAQRASPAAPRVLPVISCARADFALRREAVVMLERCLASEAAAAGGSADGADADGNVNLADDLVFVDELEAQLPRLRALAASRSLALTLVDHNQLTGALAAAANNGDGDGGSGLGACVARIVDHHVDAGAHPRVTGTARNISFDVVARRGVGSTCTLVAEALARHDADAAAAAAAASSAPPPPLLSAPIAELLLGVILLDTSCLSSHAGKTTPRDTAAVEVLSRAMATATGGVMIDAFGLDDIHHRLSSLRDDPHWWASLSPAQALGYDYKGFVAGGGALPVRYGSGVLAVHAPRFLRHPPAGDPAWAGAPQPEPKAVGALHPHAATLGGCFAFAAGKGVDMLVILSRGGGKRRAVLLHTAPPGGAFTRARFAALADGLAGVKEVGAQELAVRPPTAVSARALTPALADALASGAVRAFKFRNHRISRKQVVPILDELLAQLATEAGAVAKA